MAKKQMISMRLDKRARDIADLLRRAHGDLNLTEYIEGLIFLDAVLDPSGLAEMGLAALKVSEIPRWVLYDYPVKEFREALFLHYSARHFERERLLLHDSDRDIEKALKSNASKPDAPTSSGELLDRGKSAGAGKSTK